MIVELFKAFHKDVANIDNVDVLIAIAEVVAYAKNIESIKEIPNLKKMKGYRTAFRIKIGDYRIGITADDETIIFHRVLHRREVYRYFP
jgi:mRNA interferase RelE/StbE